MPTSSSSAAPAFREPSEQLVRRLYDQLNTGDLGQLEAFISPDFTSPTGQRGPRAFAAGIAAVRAAFPDLHYTLDAVFGARDRVAVRWTWQGTHRGAFRSFAPTGRRVTNSGMAIFELAGGKIVSTTLETDRLGFLQAIGAIPYDPAFGPSSPPPPAAAAAPR